MHEINKLRTRLKNASKNVTEYRMSVPEARTLLSEIDELLKPKELPTEIIPEEQLVITRTLDGGTF